MKYNAILIFLLIITFQVARAAEEENEINPFIKLDKNKLFQPVLDLEFWYVYSMNEKQSGEEVYDRSDAMFRRVRIGAKGNPTPWLNYIFRFSADRVGEDVYTAVKGSYNGISVWNGYFTIKPLSDKNLLNIHMGYFWTGVSREFTNSPWNVASLDKTRSNYYLRHFVSGKGNGIESGIALGGIKNFNKCAISYRTGVYEPSAYSCSNYGNKLFTGRAVLTIGDGEQSKYSYMVPANNWRKTKSISIGLGGSSQQNGKLCDSVLFKTSYTYGADLLVCYKGIRIEGECFAMKREDQAKQKIDAITWYARASYNFIIANKYIEAVVCYDSYDASGSKSVYKFIGDDNSLDMGLNWYLSKDKLKLALHYIIQDGTTSPNLGNYIGTALQFRL
ncbi:porin [Saccharicrinis aurantiacus]|uniref:porin n=1 Tax=Saccharicrinis aurantiacus TaxID=1849719 RepID=UPI0009501BF8|nr:porin [Saccharicrinis aurantiacus]